MDKRIALIEFAKNDPNCIKSFLYKTKYKDSITVDVFRAYGYSLPNVNDYDAFIYSGGMISIKNKKQYPFLYSLNDLTQNISQKDKSLLGICLGHHIILDSLASEVKMSRLELGYKQINFSKDYALFKNLKNPFFAFEFHTNSALNLSKDFRNFASTESFSIQAVQYKDKPIFGLQFHPEVNPERVKRIFSLYKKKFEQLGFFEKQFLDGFQNYSESGGIQIFENFIHQIK